MEEGFSGRCLCGAVHYRCSGEPLLAGNCYCEDCRRSGGTGHASVIGVAREALAVTGETRAYSRRADSGNMVTNHFCVTCGTLVYGENDGYPDKLFLRAGSLDDPEIFKPQVNVYASRAPSWDRPAPELPAFTEMPPRENG